MMGSSDFLLLLARGGWSDLDEHMSDCYSSEAICSDVEASYSQMGMNSSVQAYEESA